MPADELVSVVMSVLGPHPVYFPEAVRSVLTQTYQNLELVIVEDPSERRAAELLCQFPDARIRHHCNPQRTSLVEQRNLGLRLAKGDLLAILDADDVCYPHRIHEQVEFLARHPEVSVVGSQIEIIDPDGRCRGWRAYPLEHAAIEQAMPRFNPVAQPSVMFRKDAVLKAGGYRYDRYPAVEDYDLWSRLARAGTRFANLPDALLRYRIHPGGMKSAKLRGIIRGTLEVKRMHWSDRMDWRARMRAYAERALLLLPATVVLKLFVRTQYQSHRPYGAMADATTPTKSDRLTRPEG